MLVFFCLLFSVFHVLMRMCDPGSQTKDPVKVIYAQEESSV